MSYTYTPTTEADTVQLIEWTLEDPYHHENLRSKREERTTSSVGQLSPSWWFTGEGFLSYRLDDEWSALCYVRVDEEPEYLRLHVQFAPSDLVSRSRIIGGMLYAIPQMSELAAVMGKRGLITESISPNLIRFLERQGFESVGNNDYVQPVQQPTHSASTVDAGSEEWDSASRIEGQSESIA
jgi:hypothetical protein